VRPAVIMQVGDPIDCMIRDCRRVVVIRTLRMKMRCLGHDAGRSGCMGSAIRCDSALEYERHHGNEHEARDPTAKVVPDGVHESLFPGSCGDRDIVLCRPHGVGE
jgi:hypothetical protein